MKVKGQIRTECSKCGYLHVWNKRFIDQLPEGQQKYTCRKCGKVNPIEFKPSKKANSRKSVEKTS